MLTAEPVVQFFDESNYEENTDRPGELRHSVQVVTGVVVAAEIKHAQGPHGAIGNLVYGIGQ